MKTNEFKEKIISVIKKNRISTVEIADALNEPVGTIKSRIHFARKILKQKIQRY